MREAGATPVARAAMVSPEVMPSCSLARYAGRRLG
jgi:hypothetical protein